MQSTLIKNVPLTHWACLPTLCTNITLKACVETKANVETNEMMTTPFNNNKDQNNKYYGDRNA